MRPLLLLTAATALAAAAPAQPPQKQTWYEKAVKSVEATFEPAEAKPGDTVTFKLTVTLNEGYHTYPTAQPEKAAEDMVNKLKFPEAAGVTFTGEVVDPDGYKTKSEPDLGIKELRYYEGKVVYERQAKVPTSAKPGALVVKLDSFVLTVCDAKNCFPSKKLTPEATLKVK